jgi:hypothetical protein
VVASMQLDAEMHATRGQDGRPASFVYRLGRNAS